MMAGNKNSPLVISNDEEESEDEDHQSEQQTAAAAATMMMVSPSYEFSAESLVKNGHVSKSNLAVLQSKIAASRIFPMLNEEQLSLFLMCCDDNAEDAEITIRAYFDCKLNAPELFCDRNIDNEDMQNVLKTISLAVLPTWTPDQSVVFFGKLINTSYSAFHPESIMKLFFTCVDLVLHREPPQGLVAVIDAKGFGFLHITKFRLGTLKKFFHFLQEGLQIKLKDIHILNVASAIQKLLMIAKPFMKKELYDMIHLHTSDLNMQQFFRDHLPARCVPMDYGGELPNMDILALQTYNNLRKISNFLHQQELQVQGYKCDE